MLLLLVPIMGSVLYLWRKSRWGREGLRGLIILALRMLLITLLVLALALPSLRYTVDRQAVAFVADLSASTEQRRTEVEEFVKQALDARGSDDSAGVIVIGRDALVEWPVNNQGGFREFQSEVRADYTNIAEGLRLAAALLPSDARRRIVVISDGQENVGDAVEQARFLRAQGIVVDIAPLDWPSGSEVLVASLVVPSSASAGERVPVEVTVGSTRKAQAVLQVSVDGMEVATKQVALEVGETRFAFDVGIDRPGFHTVNVTIDSESDTSIQNNRVDAFVNVHGPPKILVVEHRTNAGKNISEALRATGLLVDVIPTTLFPESLEEFGVYTGTVLVDIPAESLGQSKMEVIRAAMRDLGKGLLVVGGTNSFTMGGYRGTPLEEVLPVTSEVPDREEKGKVALGLVIDKSGSMSTAGTDGLAKVEMAKEAARLSLEELEPYDLAGVVAFDASNWWLVPIGEIGSETHLKEMQDSIGTLIADGGTDIYSALGAAYEGLSNTPAPRRHIVLLTDGMSQGGNYGLFLSEMKTTEITLSTIAVGLDADSHFLEWLAEEGGGRFYFTDRARDIPQILTKETRLAARYAVVEEPTVPILAGNSPLLRATGGEFPTLGGYVSTLPRNSARVVLVSQRGDPLLSQWQHGLGRSIAWTSDSEGRWTTSLNAWERAPAFWTALVNWTLPPEEVSFQVEGDVQAGIATLVVEGEIPESARLSARIVGPRLNVMEVPLPTTALGRFEAEFPADDQGSYMLQIVEEGSQGGLRSTVTGLVAPYSPEFMVLEDNPDFLKRLAAITNGRILTNPAESFGAGLPPANGEMSIGRWLLIVAVLLLPLDIAIRRLNLSLAEVWNLPSVAKAWLLKRGVVRQSYDASPMLESIRQFRAARPRLDVSGQGHQESRVMPPASKGQTSGSEEEPAQLDKPSYVSQKREAEEAESSTERFLRAKRRARNT